MDPNKKAVYNLGLPFDNIQIICNTLMGNPRYTFKTLNQNTVAHNYILEAYNQFDKSVFMVSTDSLNDSFPKEYSEKIISIDSIDDFKEYGKLFHEFGTALLSSIANCLVKKGPFNEHRIILHKLGIAFSRHYRNFTTKIHYIDNNDKNACRFDLDVIVDDIELMIQESIQNNYVEFDTYLATTYVALTIYLTGVLINLCEKYNVTFESIYSDNATYAIDTFSDRLIHAPETEGESIKYKLLSLFYTYYLITEFYNNNLGISIVNTINMPFYNIGKKISGLDQEFIDKELQIAHLYQSELQRDHAQNTLISILSPLSIFKDFNQFDSYLMDYEMNDNILIAHGILKYAILKDADEVYVNGLFGSYLNDTDISNTDIDIFYNHFIDSFTHSVPHDISPKYFYALTVYAAGFKHIKETKSGKAKEIAALGLYQAEALMVYLYREWFMSNKAYQVTKGIAPMEKTKSYMSQYRKALTYINANVCMYNLFYIKYNNQRNFNYVLLSTIKFNFNEIIKECNSDNKTNLKDIIINQYLHATIQSLYDGNIEQSVDELIKKFNAGEINAIGAFHTLNKIDTIRFDHTKDSNSLVRINEVLEVDYPNAILDTLTKYSGTIGDDTNMIYDCKLGNLLANNIKDVVKNEKSDERSVQYVNTFIKCIIPLYMIDLKFEHNNPEHRDDLFKDTEEETSWILPNIKSTRMFNFIKK